ncbi:MAG: polyheme membrane-associated cytochrome C [Chloroflexota bacterium]|nr:MAG: polyheme membrane-associated cytochrome C [Chloroflexota bacterium]
MRRQEFRFVSFCLLFLMCLALVACGAAEASEEDIEAQWASSAHADAEARAFTRWDDADPPEIPTNCAKCHSTPGYLDFHGANDSPVGEVSQPASIGTTVECDVCHSELTADKTEAVMPSGQLLEELGPNANCMECHQGRASGIGVGEALADIETGDDVVNTEISAPSIHNSPAGPLQYGVEAHGGFEYPGKEYAGRYDHTGGFDSCIACHDAHTLTIDARRCHVCHIKAVDFASLRNIRTSNIDFDGDGDNTEGIFREILTIEERLLEQIELYVNVTEGVEPIVIDGRFTNEDGEAYTTWTPRLLRAAYNYQFSALSGGSYVHNPRYTLQLLYDSYEDLGGVMRGMTRPES